MFLFLRACISFALRSLLAFALIGAPVMAQDNAAQTILHMLDYVGVDYPEAVDDGKVKNEDEFKEMVEFTTQVVGLLETLPANPQQPALVADAEQLASMVRMKRSASEIAAFARKLRWAVVGAYNVSVAPKSAPDLKAGAKRYQALCAACHGAEGGGDGAAGAKLEPAPSDFLDRNRMAQRSIYGLYNTITLGVEGTGMASYRHLSEEERWALAFHVANFPIAAEDRSIGEALWITGKGRQAFPGIDNVATLSRNEVRERFGDEAVAMQNYLIGHPQSVSRVKHSPIAFSLEKLDEALAAYRKGDRAAAQQLAISAYLEGFELAEASLTNIDAALTREVEAEMMALRALIARGAPLHEVAAQHGKVEAVLKSARDRIAGVGPSAGTTFVSSFLILLREGLEAILVLAAIIAFIIRANRREALPYVHAGWGSALVLGVVTWIIATYAIGISGANREVTEGVTALLAAAMLVYVGFWLHRKAYAHAWQSFIQDQVGTALQKKTLWAMALVSFLAVYRELFEIVLFYQALWVQAGDSALGALIAGIAAAAVSLAAIGWAIFRYSIRLPIGPFFAVTSVLLALLAIVFTGNGVGALQEVGVIGVEPIAFVSLPALGVYPTLQTIGAQAVALAIVVSSFWLASRATPSRVKLT